MDQKGIYSCLSSVFDSCGPVFSGWYSWSWPTVWWHRRPKRWLGKLVCQLCCFHIPFEAWYNAFYMGNTVFFYDNSDLMQTGWEVCQASGPVWEKGKKKGGGGGVVDENRMASQSGVEVWNSFALPHKIPFRGPLTWSIFFFFGYTKVDVININKKHFWMN